jgi:hypothetical protein
MGGHFRQGQDQLIVSWLPLETRALSVRYTHYTVALNRINIDENEATVASIVTTIVHADKMKELAIQMGPWLTVILVISTGLPENGQAPLHHNHVEINGDGSLPPSQLPPPPLPSPFSPSFSSIQFNSIWLDVQVAK